MLAIIRMIVVLSSICGLSGFALSYLKISTAPRIEEQVLTYVQGPAILKVFADIDNSRPSRSARRSRSTAKVTVPRQEGRQARRRRAGALREGAGRRRGRHGRPRREPRHLTGIGITTMKENGPRHACGGPGLHRTVYRQTRRRAAQVAGRGHRRRFWRDHFFHRRGDRARQRREGLCGAQA